MEIAVVFMSCLILLPPLPRIANASRDIGSKDRRLRHFLLGHPYYTYIDAPLIAMEIAVPPPSLYLAYLSGPGARELHVDFE
jgi:hypothetical protein